MAYSSVPANIAEDFSVSQPKITANFAAINVVFSKDHETFDSAKQGWHKQVTFTEQVIGGAFPTVTTAEEMEIYCATNGAAPALFVRKPSQLVGVVTNDIDFTTADLAATGWTRLPSGLKMNWGIGTAHNGTDNRATFASAFTDSTPAVGVSEPNVFSVQLTLYSDVDENNFISVVKGTVRYDGFYARSWSRTGALSTSSFFYVAIGI